ncbi:hypothetical protein BABINDRAFT_159048 [Babjeviella inositovora NRRL Y-12698]|uniref:Signal recognition particle SEC65 subunit n=1 Tax=Babjeviella inositovora NRRL Y-12698 TaxID=984486 RepID=A0A1E3QXS2_9ASCO|nr:uncharacterized protein BABINDRAFT_159048 [Babjeviella inositovora NRRL Y-12698]ODQ82463.1 hypothetical protein BABINDRAFT_159048 [Babjeviella inositovora NRRL Y-12698]
MPLLEEISDIEDIDNMDMDIAQFDPSLRTPIAPALPKASVARSQDLQPEPPLFPEVPLSGPKINQNQIKTFNEEEMEHLKSFQLLYPAYFDKNRSHKEGRRCARSQATENPLAKTIVDACQALGFACVLEAEKTHPQDFGNSGRVRVLLKDEGQPEVPGINNKKRLITLVASYMQSHPTALNSLYEIPPPAELGDIRPELLPRVKGFKMNTIVPFHSPLTMKHPMARSIYEHEEPVPQVIAPKKPKQKFMKVRG